MSFIKIVESSSSVSVKEEKEKYPSFKNLYNRSIHEYEKYRFIDWQNETIFTKKYGNTSIKFLLNEFIFKSLIPFIYKNKYNISINDIMLGDYIASTLYRLDYDRLYLCNLPNDNSFDSDYYNYFYKVIDWSNFWKYWNDQTNNFFEEAEIHIESIIWAYINLESSPVHIEYVEAEKAEYPESDDEATKKLKKMDPYILDMINANNHYKFTKFDII